MVGKNTTAGELWLIERLSWALLALPFLTEFLERGTWPYGLRGFITEMTLGALILAYIVFVRRARKRLMRLEASRKTLLELIIHDLKNPVSCALGCISYLQQFPENQEKRSSLLNLALNSCRQQVHMIDQVLEVDRMELADLNIKKTVIDVGALISECTKEISGIAGLKDIEIACDVLGLPMLISDRDLLKRVLMNLLSNALKYTGEGGRISLRVSRSLGNVQFEVADTGVGMPSEKMDRLFDKFYRLEGVDQTEHRGMGLGLYFCRTAVEALGGTIKAKSAVGEGTEMVFTLPATEGGLLNRDGSRGVRLPAWFLNLSRMKRRNSLVER